MKVVVSERKSEGNRIMVRSGLKGKGKSEKITHQQNKINLAYAEATPSSIKWNLRSLL